MDKCDKCGNEYAKAFKISMLGKDYYFDSFECAIGLLAPRCNHCKTQIIGHGVESKDKLFCCAHCATSSGVLGFRDHLEEKTPINTQNNYYDEI